MLVHMCAPQTWHWRWLPVDQDVPGDGDVVLLQQNRRQRCLDLSFMSHQCRVHTENISVLGLICEWLLLHDCASDGDN